LFVDQRDFGEPAAIQNGAKAAAEVANIAFSAAVFQNVLIGRSWWRSAASAAGHVNRLAGI